jgi:hypothetical protein
MLLQLMLLLLIKNWFTCAGSSWLSCAHNFSHWRNVFLSQVVRCCQLFWLSTADDDDDAAPQASCNLAYKSEWERRSCGKHQTHAVFPAFSHVPQEGPSLRYLVLVRGVMGLCYSPCLGPWDLKKRFWVQTNPLTCRWKCCWPSATQLDVGVLSACPVG